jgi:hypothetical protein
MIIADNGVTAYVWEYTPAFAKRQRLLSSEQYELVEVRTSRGAWHARRSRVLPQRPRALSGRNYPYPQLPLGGERYGMNNLGLKTSTLTFVCRRSALGFSGALTCAPAQL